MRETGTGQQVAQLHERLMMMMMMMMTYVCMYLCMYIVYVLNQAGVVRKQNNLKNVTAVPTQFFPAGDLKSFN